MAGIPPELHLLINIVRNPSKPWKVILGGCWTLKDLNSVRKVTAVLQTTTMLHSGWCGAREVSHNPHLLRG